MRFTYPIIAHTCATGGTSVQGQVCCPDANDRGYEVALRDQQQLAVFDPATVDESGHFSAVSEVVLSPGLSAVSDPIVRQIEEMTPPRERSCSCSRRAVPHRRVVRCRDRLRTLNTGRS